MPVDLKTSKLQEANAKRFKDLVKEREGVQGGNGALLDESIGDVDASTLERIAQSAERLRQEQIECFTEQPQRIGKEFAALSVLLEGICLGRQLAK